MRYRRNITCNVRISHSRITRCFQHEGRVERRVERSKEEILDSFGQGTQLSVQTGQHRTDSVASDNTSRQRNACGDMAEINSGGLLRTYWGYSESSAAHLNLTLCEDFASQLIQCETKQRGSQNAIRMNSPLRNEFRTLQALPRTTLRVFGRSAAHLNLTLCGDKQAQMMQCENERARVGRASRAEQTTAK